MGLLRRVAGVVALCGCVGCLAPERAVVVDVSPAQWNEAVVLRYENLDTCSLRELRLFMRLDDSVLDDSLTLQITTRTPDSLQHSEYHRLVIPRQRVASSLQRVVEIPYRRRVQLHARGEYQFVLTPLRPMQGVEAVGVVLNDE